LDSSVPPLLQPYLPLVEFLGSVLGDHCEVVLHDVRKVERSILAIKNGHISNRKVGGSLTDLALKVLKNKVNLKKDFLTNYSSKTQDGKFLRSSTFFIKDAAGDVVGMMCLNMEVSKLVQVRDLLNGMIDGPNDAATNGPLEEQPIEDLHTSIEGLTTSIILKTLSELDIPPDRMSQDEKVDIVKKLNDQGVFLIKGAVTEVATHLKISEATVYRYLNKIDAKHSH